MHWIKLLLCCTLYISVAMAAKRVKRIVGGVTAAEPPFDDPVVFIRHVGKYARVEGLR
jgi:hypothetical protein